MGRASRISRQKYLMEDSLVEDQKKNRVVSKAAKSRKGSRCFKCCEVLFKSLFKCCEVLFKSLFKCCKCSCKCLCMPISHCCLACLVPLLLTVIVAIQSPEKTEAIEINAFQMAMIIILVILPRGLLVSKTTFEHIARKSLLQNKSAEK